MRLRHVVAAVAAISAALAAAPAGAEAALQARGSVGQAYVVGAAPGARLALLGPSGKTLRTGRADRLGSRIFRELPARRGYRVRVTRAGRMQTTRRFAVLRRGQNPPAAFFRSERMKAGLNYVTMRDGIELAMTVRLPPGKTLADGPFPTVVEYSGYPTAPPHDLLASVVASLSGTATTPDVLAPASSTAVGAVIAPLLDFAVVSVQMRGSGCSGGAFDLFDLPTTYDGYDAIETVAAQPWVKGRKVGMVGISFSGITQLFTAGTRPPHLAAITPMSVTDDTYSATGYPGGIRNSGFARSWITDRMEDAEPAPAGGQAWARKLVRDGDRRCRANQRLRLQTQDAVALMERTGYRDPALFAQRAGSAWMSKIQAPTFLVGQYQDEQTGGHFATSLGRLSRNRKVWISLQNGVHVDSLGPDTLTRWVEFLKLYVADEVPRIPDPVLSLSGSFYKFLADAPASPVAQSRFAGFESAAAARTEFARDPRVRLLMENGAGPAGPGAIGSAWELGYDAWPIRQVRPAWHYFGPNGTLVPEPPGEGAATYTADPRARPAQTLPGSGEADAWKAQPPYRWAPLADGKGVGFVTGALPQDVVIAGPSAVHLRLSSSARDTDLQVTLSEVRPDGNETYVQNGWLRASHRREQGGSTALAPRPTHLRQDARPIPSGEIVTVRVPIFPVAHAFRAGSRIRVTVQGPGGDRPRWRFSSVDRGRTRNVIHFGGLGNRSALVLPVIAGATANGTALPPAAALRGQPSRRYVPAANGG